MQGEAAQGGGECTELSSVKTASAGECNLIKMKNISLPIMLETVNRERERDREKDRREKIEMSKR